MTTKRRRTTMETAAGQEITTNRRQIPPEIVETILIYLPIKSLCRFSRLSKSWKSLIFDPNFTKKRAAVRDPRRLLMSRHPMALLADVSSCPLSSISPYSAVEDATPIIFPIEGMPIVHASCSEFSCVEINNSLYLCNPSTNVCKKLPDPSLPSDVENVRPNIYGYGSVYGLGFDSINDDYKIIRHELNSSFQRKSELYSLRSDSWKTIDYSPLLGGYFPPRKIVFVEGAFHLWANLPTDALVSFDSATEKFGIVASPPREELRGRVEVSALRGKLCVHSSQTDESEFCFVMWVMEEYYGNEKSWTKVLTINNADGIDGIAFAQGLAIDVTPLYVFDNGEMLFKVRTYEMDDALFIYNCEETEWEETGPWRVICRGISDGHVYEESLLSPLMFVAKKPDVF